MTLAHQKSIESDKDHHKELKSDEAVSELLLPEDRSRGEIKLKTYLKFI